MTGAWSAVIVNVAAPPWETVDMFDVMLSVGNTDDVIVTDSVFGVPVV
jgi:hypothetical protein